MSSQSKSGEKRGEGGERKVERRGWGEGAQRERERERERVVSV